MKPIIMSAESVRAILGGRKTQTRRVVKPQPRDPRTNFHFSLDGVWLLERRGYENYAARSEDGMSITCPYTVGQRLWVRETWNARDVVYDEYCGGYEAGYPLNPMPRTRPEYRYVIDFKATDGDEGPWRSPIFMPHWASRITLEVTGVRAERLQDIDNCGAIAEGVPPPRMEPCGAESHDSVQVYLEWWDKLNPKHPWASNPCVWVVEFAVAGGDR